LETRIKWGKLRNVFFQKMVSFEGVANYHQKNIPEKGIFKRPGGARLSRNLEVTRGKKKRANTKNHIYDFCLSFFYQMGSGEREGEELPGEKIPPGDG